MLKTYAAQLNERLSKAWIAWMASECCWRRITASRKNNLYKSISYKQSKKVQKRMRNFKTTRLMSDKKYDYSYF